MSVTRVELPATDAGGYDVRLEPGILAHAPRLLREHAPAAEYALVCDAHVAPLHGEPMRRALEAAGLACTLFVHPAGEGSKTRTEWARLTDALLAAGLGRDACVIALGGGVTGDLAGFVAASFMRGIPVVQVPTTLLAMVDASVGGKTGLDTPHGKNLVGAFHPPCLVLIDPLVLRTLPPAELRSGAAEVLKHGAIADADYLERTTREAHALLDPATADPLLTCELIARSVEIKAGVVGRDPHEHGERAALNFGHTLGHALERHLDYRIPHGHAVAIGMILAARAGEVCGVTAAGTGTALAAALAAFGLPVALPAGTAPEALLAGTRTDKKARRGRVRFVLLERLGCVARNGSEWTHSVPETALSSAVSAV